MPTMMSTKVTKGGQTTVPKEIREALGIQEGSRVFWSFDGTRAAVSADSRLPNEASPEEEPGQRIEANMQEAKEGHAQNAVWTGTRVGIGKDSHRFAAVAVDKPFVLGGVVFEGEPPLDANSDGDVVLHAIVRAISGITTIDTLGARATALARQGITDSRVYVREALADLDAPVRHVSVSIECAHPKISPKAAQMRGAIADLLGISDQNVGITAMTGEGLTEAGRGNAVEVTVVVTVG